MVSPEQQYKKRISLGQPGNALVILISICVIGFLILAFFKALWFLKYPREIAPVLFNKNVLSWVVLPADFDQMMSQPWSILTHMFVNDSFWKIFANMLWLWCFGYILQDMTGNRKIIPVYIYGSLGGAIGFMLAYNLLPSLHAQIPAAFALGSSPGVMAIAIVTTMVSPGYRIFPLIKGGIPLWALTIFYMITDLATISFSDTGYLVSHITGAITGFLFVFFLKLGFDWSEWMNNFFDWVGNLFNPDKPKRGKNIKEELFYRSKGEPYKKAMNPSQERIDAILDKINQQGYSFLTDEEKELLKRASEK